MDDQASIIAAVLRARGLDASITAAAAAAFTQKSAQGHSDQNPHPHAHPSEPGTPTSSSPSMSTPPSARPWTETVPQPRSPPHSPFPLQHSDAVHASPPPEPREPNTLYACGVSEFECGEDVQEEHEEPLGALPGCEFQEDNGSSAGGDQCTFGHTDANGVDEHDAADLPTRPYVPPQALFGAKGPFPYPPEHGEALLMEALESDWPLPGGMTAPTLWVAGAPVVPNITQLSLPCHLAAEASLELHSAQKNLSDELLRSTRRRSHFSIPDVMITSDSDDGRDDKEEEEAEDPPVTTSHQVVVLPDKSTSEHVPHFYDGCGQSVAHPPPSDQLDEDARHRLFFPGEGTPLAAAAATSAPQHCRDIETSRFPAVSDGDETSAPDDGDDADGAKPDQALCFSSPSSDSSTRACFFDSQQLTSNELFLQHQSSRANEEDPQTVTGNHSTDEAKYPSHPLSVYRTPISEEDSHPDLSSETDHEEIELGDRSQSFSSVDSSCSSTDSWTTPQVSPMRTLPGTPVETGLVQLLEHIRDPLPEVVRLGDFHAGQDCGLGQLVGPSEVHLGANLGAPANEEGSQDHGPSHDVPKNLSTALAGSVLPQELGPHHHIAQHEDVPFPRPESPKSRRCPPAPRVTPPSSQLTGVPGTPPGMSSPVRTPDASTSPTLAEEGEQHLPGKKPSLFAIRTNRQSDGMPSISVRTNVLPSPSLSPFRSPSLELSVSGGFLSPPPSPPIMKDPRIDGAAVVGQSH